MARTPVQSNQVSPSSSSSFVPDSPTGGTQTGFQPEKSLLEKIITSKAIPWIGGGLGAIGGGIALSPTVAGIPAGMATGGAIGAAGASAAQQSLMTLLGMQKQKPIEQLGGAVQTSAEVGSVAGLLGLLKSGSSWLSKPGVYQKAVKATEVAGEEGKAINWDKVVESTKTQLEKSGTPLSQKKLLQISSIYAPPSIESEINPNVKAPVNPNAMASQETFTQPAPELTPRRALEVRGEMTKSLPKGKLGDILTQYANITQGQGAAADRAATTEAINALRTNLSKEIHSLVPKTITPDKFYTFYSKYGGDLPTWGKRILIAELAAKVIPPAWRSIFKQAVAP